MADQDNNDDQKPIQVVFMPGCFDEFEGTQAELDTLMEQIKNSAQEWINQLPSTELDIHDLVEMTNPMAIEEIVRQMHSSRTLH